MRTSYLKVLFKAGFFSISIFTTQMSVAATVVELSGGNQMNKLMSNGSIARIGTGDGEYVLIDYKTKSVRMVMPQDRQVMDMGKGMPVMGGKVPDIKINLKSKGAGPVIAGYKTEMYEWAANGSSCGTIFGSRDALKTGGMKPLFDALRVMLEKQRSAMGGYASMMSTCQQASLKMGDFIKKIGIPMRIVKANGQVENEVKSIKTGVKLPKGTFSAPSSYRTVSMNDMMSEQMGGMRNSQGRSQGGMPQDAMGGMDMSGLQEQMMKMQRSGQIPPEAMEQFKQYQQMMQGQ